MLLFLLWRGHSSAIDIAFSANRSFASFDNRSCDESSSLSLSCSSAFMFVSAECSSSFVSSDEFGEKLTFTRSFHLH